MTALQSFISEVGHVQATDIPDTVIYEDQQWDDSHHDDTNDPEACFSGRGQGFGWSEAKTEGMILEGVL